MIRRNTSFIAAESRVPHGRFWERPTTAGGIKDQQIMVASTPRLTAALTHRHENQEDGNNRIKVYGNQSPRHAGAFRFRRRMIDLLLWNTDPRLD